GHMKTRRRDDLTPNTADINAGPVFHARLDRPNVQMIGHDHVDVLTSVNSASRDAGCGADWPDLGLEPHDAVSPLLPVHVQHDHAVIFAARTADVEVWMALEDVRIYVLIETCV